MIALRSRRSRCISNAPGTSTGNQPTLTLDFKYPDGTAVAGTLNYAVSSGAVKLSGAVPLNNGQATCKLFNSPSALGLSGQFNVTLSLTNSANKSLWQITLAMDPTNVSLGVGGELDAERGRAEVARGFLGLQYGAAPTKGLGWWGRRFFVAEWQRRPRGFSLADMGRSSAAPVQPCRALP